MSLKSLVPDITNIPTQSGIYKMLDANGKIIYVGKAKNLKARVSSYFQNRDQSAKTAVLVSRIADIQTIVTRTENEALLLEQTLIKEHRPRYNIVLRDDKSYPYLYLSPHVFPSLRFTRSRKKGNKGHYFGPYSKPTALKETLELIQKFFKIRNCEDSFFANRSRPCLQYQIGRCKAPCVQKVSPEEYAEDVHNVTLFLEGKNKGVMEALTEQMKKASESHQFEKAIEVRDQITALQSILQKQYVAGLDEDSNFDLIFALIEGPIGVVQKLLVREGNVLDQRSYLLPLPKEIALTEMLDTFLAQHYLTQEEIPPQIYVNEESTEQIILASVLSEKQGRNIVIHEPKRGEKKQWLELARVNALQTLEQYQAKRASYGARFGDLRSLLSSQPRGLTAGSMDPVVKPRDFEQLICFDISHTMGEATVASCVVFNEQGSDKNSYRRFNIEGITPGDDYAAMRQALSRYYASQTPSNSPLSGGGPLRDTPDFRDSINGSLPDKGGLGRVCEPAYTRNILLIDGGKGQLTQAEKVLSDLNITDTQILGIAKGEGRKSGLETIFLNSHGDTLNLNGHPLAFLLLQEVRDEAHRFAITGHRHRRDKKRRTSTLEMIEGIGPKRRAQLLAHFGGLQGLKSATAEQIAKVPGISLALANKILQSWKGVNSESE